MIENTDIVEDFLRKLANEYCENNPECSVEERMVNLRGAYSLYLDFIEEHRQFCERFRREQDEAEV